MFEHFNKGFGNNVMDECKKYINPLTKISLVSLNQETTEY